MKINLKDYTNKVAKTGEDWINLVCECKEISAKQMKEAINDGTAKVLTLEAIEGLKGKRIAWAYFPYEQNGFCVEECVVGDLYLGKDMYGELVNLYDVNEKDTQMFCQPSLTENRFVCSDTDRDVFYLVLD